MGKRYPGAKQKFDCQLQVTLKIMSVNHKLFHCEIIQKKFH